MNPTWLSSTIIGARHDGLPRQFSPLLPVVYRISLCEGFAGPFRDVVNPPLFSDYIIIIPLPRLPSTAPCSIILVIGHPIFSPFQFSPLYIQLPGDLRTVLFMLCDGFPHMFVISDSLLVYRRLAGLPGFARDSSSIIMYICAFYFDIIYFHFFSADHGIPQTFYYILTT